MKRFFLRLLCLLLGHSVDRFGVCGSCGQKTG